jgi:predicted Ser/Thr protein kinase
MSSQAAPTPGRGVSAATAAATPAGSGSIALNPSSITRSVAPSGPDRLIGRVVGHCRLVRRLGRGGMGDVYLGVHQDLKKQVAVKILPPDVTRNDELLARFRREAESAARLEHPNIIEIYDIGCDGGLHYMIMGFVDGQSLQELVDLRKMVEPREAARIALEIARGLQAVHADGIIHRDIKPANVLLNRRNEVKIIDFGLAFDAEDKTALTITGSIMGTPWYLSPEQAEGKRADTRSDLYSLGIVLYILVTGERPFSGETHMSVLYKQIHEKPRDPRLINSDVPPEIAEIVLRAMEKRPERRYQTADEFASDLSHFLRGTYVRRSGFNAMPDPVKTRKRKSAFLTAAFVAWILGLLGAVVGAFILAPRPGAARAAAPAPEAAPAPDVLTASVLGDEELRRVAARDYAPVLNRLLERHQVAATPDERHALSRVGLRLSAAARVADAYRASPARPAASDARAVADTAARSRDVSPADLAWFLIVEGDALRALDHVLQGTDVVPAARAQFDEIAAAALSQRRDAPEIARRLAGVRRR